MCVHGFRRMMGRVLRATTDGRPAEDRIAACEKREIARQPSTGSQVLEVPTARGANLGHDCDVVDAVQPGAAR